MNRFTSIKGSPKTFWGGLALSPAIGVAMGLSFPPYGIWPLSIISLIVLLSITWRLTLTQNLAIWWVSGSAFFLFLLHWLRVVGSDAWLAASLALALWWLIASIGVNLVKNLPWAPIWVGSVLTTVEIVKSRWPWDGFPWGQLAFPLSEGFLASYLPFVASLGLGWVGATFAACIAWLTRPNFLAPQAKRVPWAVVGLGLLVVPLVLGPVNRLALGNSAEGGNDSRTAAQSASSIAVAMVQGNVPQVGLDFNARRLAIIRNHLRLTDSLTVDMLSRDLSTASRPELIIWPENSSDIDPLTDALIYADISQAANKADVPILVGAVIENPANSEQVLNAGILWEPNKGPTQIYIKQNPVMFGEFVPFRGLLTSLIGRFERVPRDFAKGDSPGVFNIAGKQVGDVICFEVANDAVVRNTVRAGAQTLVIQTNNATYNLLGQTEQQLQIGRVRAREFDRFVLVSALSGISAVVSNEGKVLEMAGEFESAILETNVPLIERQTLSARFGHSITLFIFTLGVLSITLGASLSFVNRR